MLLEVVGRDGVKLERASIHGGRTAAWETLCEVPCRGYVPAYGSYRVVSSNGSVSDAFTLPGPPGTSVTLKADDDGRVWTRNSSDRAPKRDLDSNRGLGLVFFLH